MKCDDLKIGQSYEMQRRFSEQDIKSFADLSHDTNPIHTDSEFARNSRFGRLIVPGFLTASLFSAIIGTKFPGIGSVYLIQNMIFRNPVFIDQLVKASVSVKELYPEKNRVLLETLCKDENNVILIEGTALVKLP